MSVDVNCLSMCSLFNDRRATVSLNTTSGRFQGQQVIVRDVFVRQYFGIPYGEQPRRFQRAILRHYNNRTIQQATKRTAACLQMAGGLAYGPFQLSDMYDGDCLTLNIFQPETSSTRSKAIMVFCHGGSNQIGSGSLFDGSALAAIGDIIVITINYRLNLFGFLSSTTDKISGNYGLYDQLLALKWISINAKMFHGNPKQITYVGHSTGSVNALLLAMSKQADGLIARVIAQSGNPLNSW
jgi:carboxylesterase type B